MTKRMGNAFVKVHFDSIPHRQFLFVLVLCLSSQFRGWSQTLIYTQDFNNTFPPSGWLITNAGSGNNWTLNTSSTYAYNGNYSMQYSYSNSSAANTWAFMQGVNMIAGNTYTLKFYESVRSSSYTEKMKVTVGTAQTVGSQTTTLLTLSSLTNTAFAEQTTATFTPFHLWSLLFCI